MKDIDREGLFDTLCDICVYMCVYMCICVYMCVYMCICVYTCAHVIMYVYMYMYTCTYIRMHTYIEILWQGETCYAAHSGVSCICKHAYMQLHSYIHICTYVYIHRKPVVERAAGGTCLYVWEACVCETCAHVYTHKHSSRVTYE